ncbi:MAG: hypothetical protein GY754_02365 [bacterium]|nr:hypothetical protein [bacterium]
MRNLTRKGFVKTCGSVLAALFVGSSFSRVFASSKKKGYHKKASQLKAQIAGLKKKVNSLQNTIRKDKAALKARGKTGKPCGHIDARLHKNGIKMRHYLIAYSELKGRMRKEIERPGKNNLPSERAISRIKNQYS